MIASNQYKPVTREEESLCLQEGETWSEHEKSLFSQFSCSISVSHDNRLSPPYAAVMYLDTPVFNHPKTRNEPFRFRHDDPVLAVRSLKNQFVQQVDCKHHLVCRKDRNGTALTNGDATCEHCGLMIDQYLPAGKTQQTYVDNCLGFEEGRRAVALQDWPTAECHLQGGTAFGGKEFFEAFPVIHGIETFIRGEGDSLAEAEEAAFSLYTAQSSCGSHTWSRTVKGKHRSDGYAVCEHCGLTGMALEPLTTCQHCDEPTSNMVGNTFLCLAHTYSLNEDEYMKLSRAEEEKKDEAKDESPLSALFGRVNPVTERILFRVYKQAFNQAFKSDSDRFKAYKHRLIAFSGKLEEACQKAIGKTGIDALSSLNEDEYANPAVQSVINRHLIALPAMIWDIEKKEGKHA